MQPERRAGLQRQRVENVGFSFFKFSPMTFNTLVCSAVFGLFTLSVVPVVAQSDAARPPRAQKAPEERADDMTRRMTRDLVLTPEQQPKVAALNEKLAKDLKALRDAGKAAKGQRRGQAEEIRTNYETSLKATLTPEQYATHEKRRAQNEQKMRERREIRRNAHRSEKLTPEKGQMIPPGPAQD
jgi:periplasmic protein CpxP/Spy